MVSDAFDATSVTLIPVAGPLTICELRDGVAAALQHLLLHHQLAVNVDLAKLHGVQFTTKAKQGTEIL